MSRGLSAGRGEVAPFHHLHRFAQGVDGPGDEPRHPQKHPGEQEQDGALARDQRVAGRAGLAVDLVVIKDAAQPHPGQAAGHPAEEIFFAPQCTDPIALPAFRQGERRAAAAAVDQLSAAVQIQFARRGGQAADFAVQQRAHVQRGDHGAQRGQADVLALQNGAPAEQVGVICVHRRQQGKAAGLLLQQSLHLRAMLGGGVRHLFADGQGVWPYRSVYWMLLSWRLW